MTSLSIVIVCFTVITQAIYARDIKAKTSVVTSPPTPANMTYDELLYILQTRRGELHAKPKHLTPCAKAILSCCNDKKMNEYCSESFKCGAYFFDDNPCEDKFIKDALEAAKVYYEQLTNNA